MTTPRGRDERRRELEALLRQPAERLTAPDGAWEAISRRAGHRKWAKAAIGVAAGVIIVAGAVPAVIAVRHSSNNQTLGIASSKQPRPTPGRPSAPLSSRPQTPAAVPVALAGFFPDSLSFISPTEGFLWGSVGTSRRGVVARTDDGGSSWTRVAAPAVDNAFLAAPHGDAQIRFATGTVGFVYGAKYFVTQDAAQSWQRFRSPGYIDDIEAMNGRVWALVRRCQSCLGVRLYGATAADPRLRKVRSVPLMHGRAGTPEVAGATSLAVSGPNVYVMVGSSSFWASTDGKQWRPRPNPCPAQVKHSSVKSALVATTDSYGLVAACGYNVNGSAETKRVYESAKFGTHWNAVPTEPAASGYLQTLTAGSPADVIIGTSRAGALQTHNGGRSWTAADAGGQQLSFVGFIDATHVVAVTDPTGSGAFATSYDAGRSWTVTGFAN